MSFKSRFRFRRLFLLAALFLGAGKASAQQGPATNRNSASVELTITATVVPALYVRISTSSGGATVTGVAGAGGPASAGASSLDFGAVDGMGTARPAAAGVSVNLSHPAGALYTTPITLTPYFSGFSSTTATVTVAQDQSSDLGTAAELREGDSPASASAVSTAAPTVVTSTANSGAPITRYVGLFIKNSTDISIRETVRAKLVYEITVP